MLSSSRGNSCIPTVDMHEYSIAVNFHFDQFSSSFQFVNQISRINKNLEYLNDSQPLERYHSDNGINWKCCFFDSVLMTLNTVYVMTYKWPLTEFIEIWSFQQIMNLLTLLPTNVSIEMIISHHITLSRRLKLAIQKNGCILMGTTLW